ncbi:hypothetical protein BDR03DRAFT_976496 [Suillus americanus]|nr:hypothetical protein BDR03DRAFT_976496 [Suillus americanus]
MYLSLPRDIDVLLIRFTLGLFVLRTYALWNNNRIVLVAVLFVFFATSVSCIGIFFVIGATTDVMISTIPGIPGCSQSEQVNKFFLLFILALVFQLGPACLTIIRVIQSWRSAEGPLYATLVNHNILYYACGLLFSTVNVFCQCCF